MTHVGRITSTIGLMQRNQMQKFHRVGQWAVIGVAIAAACGGDQGRPRWSGAVDTIAGVPVVRNPAGPIYPAGYARLEGVWTQAGPGGANAWQEPRRLAVSGGLVFILDASIHRVYVLDGGTGEQFTGFGRQGGGPNELSAPRDIAAVGTDHALILDRGMLKRFDRQGVERGLQRLDAIGFGIAALGPDRHMMTGFGTGSRLSIIEGDSVRPQAIPAPLSDVDAGLPSCERLDGVRGLVVAMSCIVPYFRMFDPAGNAAREILIAREPVVRPQAQLDSMIARMRSNMAEAGSPAAELDALVRERRETWRFLRPFTSVRLDSVAGWISLLEEEPDPATANPPTLHLFDSDGRYTAAVRDTLFWWDYAFLDGDIVALIRDPGTGLVAATRYRLVWSKDPSLESNL